MKSLYTLTTIILLSHFGANAQILDKEALECQYKFTWMPDSMQTGNTREDFMILKAGNKVSDFYSYNTARVDSAIDADTKKGLSSVEILAKRASYGKRGMEYHIFKNYPASKITVTQKIISDYYKYEEPLAQHWTILKETKVIKGYKAQKATCFFSGRQYIAWFTNEIPLPSGPWKLNGLPGLILEAQDKAGYFKFELAGIRKTTSGEIELASKPYINTNKKAFLKLEEKFKKDPVGFINANTGAQIKPVAGTAIKDRPYNPMEF